MPILQGADRRIKEKHPRLYAGVPPLSNKWYTVLLCGSITELVPMWIDNVDAKILLSPKVSSLGGGRRGDCRIVYLWRRKVVFSIWQYLWCSVNLWSGVCIHKPINPIYWIPGLWYTSDSSRFIFSIQSDMLIFVWKQETGILLLVMKMLINPLGLLDTKTGVSFWKF